MQQTATVQRILSNGRAEIAVPRKSACGHDCEECAGCGVTGTSVLAEAENPIGAKPGDKVVVESSSGTVLGIIAVVYLIPVILFLLGYFLTGGFLPTEGLRYAAAGIAFAIGLLPAVVLDRRMKKRGNLCYTVVQNLSL